MGENEKLGFTFEVAPYDLKDFNKFFDATTPWVDDECNTAPKVLRDSLCPPMSPSPLREDTAQRLNKAFKDLQETMSKGFPILFKKPHKNKNKHYKPKFTL